MWGLFPKCSVIFPYFQGPILTLMKKDQGTLRLDQMLPKSQPDHHPDVLQRVAYICSGLQSKCAPVGAEKGKKHSQIFLR